MSLLKSMESYEGFINIFHEYEKSRTFLNYMKLLEIA